MSIPTLTDLLPATIGGRHIGLELQWPGHGRVRVWLTPDRDLAVDAVAVVELLEITEPETFEHHPVTWTHQWTPPLTRAFLVTYLWSREEALRAASLAGDPRIGAEFVRWLEGHHRDLHRYWEDTLAAALPQTRGRAGEREIDIQTAATRLSERTGRRITRAFLLEVMHESEWIVRPPSGNGWRPTLEARARDVAYSRVVALPGNAGSYEQCFLTDTGYQQLAQHVTALPEGTPTLEGLTNE